MDGKLKPRPMIMYVHGYIQSLISHWFGMYKKDWNVIVAIEVRTGVSRPACGCGM
jgi:hypothetical protein